MLFQTPTLKVSKHSLRRRRIAVEQRRANAEQPGRAELTLKGVEQSGSGGPFARTRRIVQAGAFDHATRLEPAMPGSGLALPVRFSLWSR